MELFVTAFGLGVAICIIPGAVTAEAMRRGLARGYLAALMFELGSLVGDAAWAALALAGAAAVVRLPAVRIALGVAGTLLLLRLAWRAFKAHTEPAQATAPLRKRGDFGAGAVLSLANPGAPAFWIGVSGLVAATTSAGFAAYAVFLAGFMLAATVYCFVAAAVFASGRRLLPAPVLRGLNLVSAAALVAFAGRLALSTARGLAG